MENKKNIIKSRKSSQRAIIQSLQQQLEMCRMELKVEQRKKGTVMKRQKIEKLFKRLDKDDDEFIDRVRASLKMIRVR